jgi:16S rRNA (adenine1518-N6/adenine1519-N6)-dimethyltransferase
VRARKRFGQHFLHDPAVIGRIIAAIAPRADNALVEIGPGTGALTASLLDLVPRLDAIEIDRDLAAALRRRFAAHGSLHLHEQDALDFDWQALAQDRGRRLRLVGNLPYNISTPLLFALLPHMPVIEDMHFMLQKEVVDRIVAPPGSRTYGRLTVMLAPFVTTVRVLDVGPGAFRPPPQVHSAVVRMQARTGIPAWAALPQYAAVVSAAFGQRRKQLRNSLSSLLEPAQMAACGIDPRARAETLSSDQFGLLAQAAALVVH